MTGARTEAVGVAGMAGAVLQGVSEDPAQVHRGSSPITGSPGVGYVMAEGPDGVLIELFEARSSLLSDGAKEWFAW